MEAHMPSGEIAKRASRSASVVVTFLLIGCAGGSRSGGDDWTATVDTVAGVVHVVNTPPEGGPQPTLVAEEEFRIGTVEGGGPTSFGLIRAIAVLPDGRFAVADAQAEEVRLFARDGAYLRTFGGKGQGPGELEGMQGVYVQNGMLRVPEQGNARLSVFDPDSGFVRTYPLHLFSYGFRGPWPAAVDSAGHTFVASSGAYGEGRSWDMVRVYDPAMKQLDSIPYHDYTDEINRDEVPGAWKVQLGSNAWSWAPVPFYARPYQVLTPNGEFWGTTGGSPRLEVARWKPAGDTSLVFTSLRKPEPVTSAERDSAMNALEERYSRPSGNRPHLDPSRVPAEKPTAYGLSLDDLGRLWVRVGEPSADATEYDVFDRNGHHAETVRMPFRVDAWVPPVVHGDTAWAVVTDDTDVQYVVRARMHPVIGDQPGAGR